MTQHKPDNRKKLIREALEGIFGGVFQHLLVRQSEDLSTHRQRDKH